VGDAGARPGHQLELLVVEVDAVREPDVRAEPAALLHVGQRARADHLDAEVVLVLGLGQVRVQADLVLSGQPRRLDEQLVGDREGRARRERQPAHGEALGVVEQVDDALAVLEDLVGLLDHVVRRQAALALAARHRAPGGVEARAQLPGALDGLVEELGGLALGEDVEVVGDGGAAGEQQLADAELRADAHVLGGQLAPDLVEADQPVEELGVLYVGQVLLEGLVQVVVGVDHAGMASPPCASMVSVIFASLGGSPVPSETMAGPSTRIHASRSSRSASSMVTSQPMFLIRVDMMGLGLRPGGRSVGRRQES
jgi:hypothetical protein